MPTAIDTKEKWLEVLKERPLGILYMGRDNKIWSRDPDDTDTVPVQWTIVVYDKSMRHLGEILAETIYKKTKKGVILHHGFDGRMLHVLANDRKFAEDIYNLTVIALDASYVIDKPRKASDN